MRFTHLLLLSLVLTPSLPTITSFPLQTCYNGPSKCKTCVGESNCCADPSSKNYGHCARPGFFDWLFQWSITTNCPDGSRYTCSGDGCPKAIDCEFLGKKCDKFDQYCWGTITCDDDRCPPGYSQGDFCYQDGSSRKFKVCGSGNINIPQEIPTTITPTTQAPTTKTPTYAPTTKQPGYGPTQTPTTKAPTTKAPTTKAPTTKAPTTKAPTTKAPATTAPTTPTGAARPNAGSEVPTPQNVVCYQEVVGSLTGTYAQVSAALDTWQQQMYQSLGLKGPLELAVGHAQIPDRVSFENGCDGPYDTMADLFVHIQTTPEEYDLISSKLEAFIAAHPLTSYSSIDCSARSIVTYLPTCGKLDIPSPKPDVPRPNDKSQLCYQEVVGSLDGTYAEVSAVLDAWEQKMYRTLNLTGPIELAVGHARIPNRINFENGCDGPYPAMADLFVHIDTTYGQYDALSAQLEAFIKANPLNQLQPISCTARSNVAELPNCGKIPNPPPTGQGVIIPSQPGQQICPVVTFTSRVEIADRTEYGKYLYTIIYDITSRDQTIQYIDVHITTSLGFFNYRMIQASSSSYEFTFPSYLALGPGETIYYWFTTSSTSTSYPNPWACDSISFTYIEQGIRTLPTQAPKPICPSATFAHNITRIGNGVISGTSRYAISLTSNTIEWVDVHINANGGFFNYRMDQKIGKFEIILPSPHLNLAKGTKFSFWYTYYANNTACDSKTYAVTTVV